MSISNGYELIRKLKKEPENFYIVHYSCQSLYDDNESLSPRITSIVVAHFATEQTVSFSTHAIAERLAIDRENVRQHFDDIEANLLSDFYEFVKDRKENYWIHWNMRNLMYGFEHLEHRCRVLGRSDTIRIPFERRINLNDMLARRYGAAYAPHPKMKSLMELNGAIHRHFLTGEEEVNAFNSGEYIRMHNSTLCKVEFFHYAIRAMISGRLRTKSKGFGVKLDRLFESRLVKVGGLLGTIVGVPLAIWRIVEHLLS